MKPELVRKTGDRPFRAQALRDLDILNVLTLADPRFDTDSALRWTQEYLSSDGEEISLRLDLLEELCACADPAVFGEALEALRSVAAENGKYERALTRVDEVLYLWRRAERYLRTLRLFLAFLPEEPRSARLRDFRAFLAALDAGSAPIADALQKMDGLLRLPKQIYVDVNVKEDGTPQEYAIVGETYDGAGVNSLLGPRDLSRPADSLAAEFVYNSNLYGYHFDEYFNRALEKEWKNILPKARKLLLNTPLPEREALCALEEELAWCLTGLRLRATFAACGYSLCRPVVTRGGLTAEALCYPELILHREGITGNPIRVENGQSVIVTGANHSGKTSYLKTVGQSLLLAQLGFFVPAAAFSFEPVTDIFTLFSAGEDDSMDASRMGIEIGKINDITENARPGDLILLNEPLTSTNPVEAVSICAELCRGFLEKGITHLLVTHLYDIYFLLKAQLSGKPEEARLRSLVTESRYDAERGAMVHEYRLREDEPEGNSYARETAAAFGITPEGMLSDAAELRLANGYLSARRSSTLYKGGND